MSLNVPLLRDWVILAFNVFSCYLSSELFWPVNFFKVTGPYSVIGSSTPDRATRSSSTSTCSRWRETQQVWCDIDLDRNEARLLRGHMDPWLSIRDLKTNNQGLSSWPDCLQSAAARLLPWGFGHGEPRPRLPSSCAVTLWTPTNRSSPRQTSSSSPSTSQTRPSGLKDSRQPGRKSRWFTSRILRYIDSGCLTSGCSQLQQSNGIQVSELFLLYF